MGDRIDDSPVQNLDDVGVRELDEASRLELEPPTETLLLEQLGSGTSRTTLRRIVSSIARKTLHIPPRPSSEATR